MRAGALALAAAAVTLLAPAAATAGETRRAAAADAYVSAASRNANYGRAKTLLADAAPVTRSYVRFVVPALSGTLTKVQLQVTAKRASAAGLVVRKAGSSWSERTLRFRTAPGLSGPSVASGALRAGRNTLDVSALVRGPGAVTLVLTTRSRTPITLTSREGAAAARPVLVATTNGSPVCAAGAIDVDEDAAGGASAPCSDPDGDPLTYEIVSQGSKGTASVAGTELRYTPTANATGADSFSFRASDGRATSPAATASVTIRPVNDLPTCQARTLTTPEDTLGNVAPVCADVDGDPLTYEISTQPSGGTASAAGDQLRYAPNAEANGADQFAYRAKDAGGAGAPASVTVSVTAVNDRPLVVFDTRSVPEDGTLAFPAASLLTNDAPGPANEAGQTLTVTAVSAGPQTHGTVDLAGGQVSYRPAANFNGAASFAYTACDSGSPSECSEGSVSVSVAAVNDLPSCQDVSLTTLEDTPGERSPSCSDVEGDSLGYEIAAQGIKGVASVTSGGTLRYVPNANQTGSDSFTYRAVESGGGASGPATVNVTIDSGNDPPVVESVTVSPADPRTATTLTAAVTSSDPEGDSRTHAYQWRKNGSDIPGATGATLDLHQAGNGDKGDQIDVRVVASDGQTESAPRTSDSVTVLNSPPALTSVVIDQASPTTTTVLTVSAVSSDADGDPRSLALQWRKNGADIPGATGATLDLGQAGNGDKGQQISVRVTASDGAASSPPVTSAAVTIVNAAPSCSPVALTTNEDESGTTDPSCSDPDGDPLTFSIASQGTKGAASITGTLRLRYIPSANENGADAFAYRATEAGGGAASPSATVSVTITPVNDRPTVNPDNRTVEEDGTLVTSAASLAANDLPGPSNELGQAVAVTSVAAGVNTHGTVQFAGGQVTYAPATNFNGTATFTYTACDSGSPSQCDSGSVSVTVTPTGDSPTCGNVSLAIAEDTAGSVAPSCTNPDGDALTYEIVEQGAKGDASVVAGQLRYEPDADATGGDSFRYRARNGFGASAAATVSVTISTRNDAPSCSDRSLTTDEETMAVIAPACTDPEGDGVTFEIAEQGTKGTAFVDVDTGKLVYDPHANQTGADSFTYVGSDGAATGAPARVSVTINAVNDVPEAVPFDVATPENTPRTIALLADDAEGDALTYVVESLPAGGALHVGGGTGGHRIVGAELPYELPGAEVTYAPAAGFTGPDGFGYSASDGTDTSEPVEVSITVQGVNGEPVCTDGDFTVAEDQDVSGEVCTDPDGDELTFDVTGPTHGELELFDDGGFSYVPDPDFFGSDSFAVTATDPDGDSSGEATVTITVTPDGGDAPACEPASLETEAGVEGETAPACVDPDGDALTYSIVSQGTKGTASVAAGKLRYDPNAGATGDDVFTYAASDGAFTSAPANVDVVISASNAAPACSDATLAIDEDDNGVASPNCTDANADPLTYEVVAQGTKGTAWVEDGELFYAPGPDENGSDFFTYRANDGEFDSGEARVDVTITAVNDAPVANLDEFPTVLDGASVDINVRKNDLDGPPNESSQSLTVTGVTDPATGSARVVGGDVEYTPEEGAPGDVFQYTVCDNGTPSRCATGTISVMVVHGTFATVETAPVAHSLGASRDSADDPAIWVHPTDPSLSTVIGTDKTGGLEVYDLSGARIQSLDPTRQMNNVDLRDGFALPGQPAPVTLVVASDRTGGGWRLNLYRVDPATRGLIAVRTVPLTFEPYGLCLYQSAGSGKLYAFMNEEDSTVGRMEQWELAPDAASTGGVKATKIRQWNVGSEAEGCVADDGLGHLYVAEEDVGIWKYGAEPTVSVATRTRVDSVDHTSGHLRQDAEGLAIVYGEGGDGYLLASSQGNNTFAVYERGGDNAWLRNVRLDTNFDVDPLVDGVSDTDGIDVAAVSLGPAFAGGLFVVQDGTNSDPSGNQNYKLVPLDGLLAGLPPPF